MAITLRRLASVALLVTAAACSGSNTSPSVPSLTGSVTDPAGDTVILPVLRDGLLLTPFVPVAPDLIAAALDASGGSLTATISFAPGTFSRTDSFACVMLDVDENAGTGVPSPGGDVPLGYDYSICAVSPRASTTAQVSQWSSGTAVGVGSVAATFPSADQVRFTVPLSMLGNDDGRMAFKVQSMQWVDLPILNTASIDWMPDLTRAAGLVR